MSTLAPTRRTDPWTSYVAARGVDVGGQRLRVFAILVESGPLTDEELVREHHRRMIDRGWPRASASGLRSRRHELTVDGYVEPVEDSTARTTLGGRTLRWRVVPRVELPVQRLCPHCQVVHECDHCHDDPPRGHTCPVCGAQS